ncbi:uncharacterized protein IL334_003927 [Kwoniella shivajii]|uniref:Uncharacterized protein n=1 Tax=Kwoniella shivajii TaxID=564305 RepID=A0ABZ1D067_9TREE|nr:hypothetical protein IL334_003927 [Kwoniella shivajii]
MSLPSRINPFLKNFPQFTLIDAPGSIKLYCTIPSARREVYEVIAKYAENPRIYGFAAYDYRGHTYAIFGQDDPFRHEEVQHLLRQLQVAADSRHHVLYAFYEC